MSSSPPYPAPSRTTSTAADCRPRRSPPASSPAASAASSRRASGASSPEASHALPHRGHHVLPGQDVALDGVPVAGHAAGPVEARGPGVGRGVAVEVDDADLAVVAALVLLEQPLQGDVGGRALVEVGQRRGPCRRRWRPPAWRWRRPRPPRPARRTPRPGTWRRRRRPTTHRQRTGPRSRTSWPHPSAASECEPRRAIPACP